MTPAQEAERAQAEKRRRAEERAKLIRETQRKNAAARTARRLDILREERPMSEGFRDVTDWVPYQCQHQGCDRPATHTDPDTAEFTCAAHKWLLSRAERRS